MIQRETSALRTVHQAELTGAEASFVAASHDHDWQWRLRTITDIVIALGPRLEVAAVQTTTPTVLSGFLMTALPPHPPSGSARVRQSHVAREYVMDACGIQVLTGRHLARAHDLSTWTVMPLGNDRHLVSHPDAAAWYAAEEPDPAVLTQARHDFGDLVLTRDSYRDFVPARVAPRES